MLFALALAHAEDSATDLGGTSVPPASMLIGADADGVDTPSTPADVAVALGNIVPEGSPGLPDGVALEVAPFWLGPNPTTVREYVGGGAWTIWRNLRVSAVAQADGDAWTGALGARTTIWGRAPKGSEARKFTDDYDALKAATPETRADVEGKVQSECGKTLVALREVNRTMADELREKRREQEAILQKMEDEQDAVCQDPAIKRFGEAAGWCRDYGFAPIGEGAAGTLPADKDDTLLAWLEARQKKADAANDAITKLRAAAGKSALEPTAEVDKKIADKAEGPAGTPKATKFDTQRLEGCKTLLSEPRKGLVVEIGGAYGATSPDSTYGGFGPAGYGAYVVGTYFFGRPAISAMGRVVGGGTETTEGDTVLEAGGGLVYSLRKVDAGVSGLFGYGLDAQDWRVDMLARFNYRVTSSLWLVSSFGARLPFTALDETSVLSQLSLHFNFGENRPTQAELLSFDDVKVEE